MNSYFHLQWKEFPTPMVDSSFCYFRENQGWFWQSQGGWIKQMERMGPHTSLGQSIPDCDKDILLTDASRTQKNHVLLKRGCFEKFIFKRRHRELGKNKLNFPNDLGGWESLDCRIWATQRGLEITVERSISSIQIGINKEKEFWSDWTLKLKRFNIAC